jgi:hypothetical protein
MARRRNMDTVRETPSGGSPTQDAPAPGKKPSPIWKSPVTVWLRSTYLDSERYLRLGIHGDFEGASWPLGIQFALDHFERDSYKLERLRVALQYEIVWPTIDNAFDSHARMAWQLPWLHSRIYLYPRNRRSNANFVMVNIGDWPKGRIRYDEIKLLLGNERLGSGVAGTIREIYALTPFSVIVQHEIEDFRPYNIFHTYIVSFYTFETFIQECLVRDAMRKGIAQGRILAAYEHVYCNSSAIPEAVPTDVAELELAKLVELPVDWSTIRITKSRSLTGAQARRRSLFQLRLQTHLMVAIAAACHGIRAFTEPGAGSPLVRPAGSLPDIDDLAPFWLRHMMGAYDHAAEAERLLANVARRYGTNLAPDRFGLLTAEPLVPRASPELALIGGAPPILRRGGDRQAADRLRASPFEFSLDDESLLDWQRTLGGE